MFSFRAYERGGGIRGNLMITILREHRDKVLMVLLLVFLGGYRVLLIQTGQLYWPDEYRYLHALHLLDELRQGDPTRGLFWIFGSEATEAGVGSRPMYIFLSTIPAFIQALAHLFMRLDPIDPAFYRIPAVLNVAVSLGVAVLFYRIVLLVSGDRALALLGVFVHGLLANTNLYVRHLLAYDLSLLLLLASLVMLLDHRIQPNSRSRVIVAGLLAGIGITTYPGYYHFPLILVVALMVMPHGSWRLASVFLASILSVFVGLEGVARLGGFSFIGSAYRFSKIVPSGLDELFGEGYRSLPFYLLKVEGFAGVLLLALFAWFLVLAVRGGCGRTEIAVIGAAAAAYLIHATSVVVFHFGALHGRLLHMYFPFVVLASVLAVKIVPGSKLRMGLAGILMAASVISFVPTAAHALAIHYPRDVARSLIDSLEPGTKTCNKVDDTGGIVKASIDCNFTAATALVVRYSRDIVREPADSVAPETKVCNRWKDDEGRIEELASDCDVVLDNFRNLYPPSLEMTDAAPPPGFVLSAAYDHPLQFAPYWFEGFRPDERVRLATHPPRMRVYTRIIPLGKNLPTTNETTRDGR